MKVAYLTMAYDRAKTLQMAIPNCADQIGPYDKVLYIMHQAPFEPPIKHDLPIRIREYDVGGIEGYGWWLLKFAKFLEVCDEEYVIWWDEDDHRESTYTLKAMRALTGEICETFSGEPCKPHDVAWNMWNYEVKRGSIYRKEYTSGMGTLVAKVDALREPVAELLAKWPDGRLRIDANRNPVDCNFEGTWSYAGGALDAYAKRILKDKYEVGEHEGVRFMTFHSLTNTKGGRKPEENVDYVGNTI